MYDELVKELRDSAEWADRLALLMGRAEGDAHAPVMRKAADAIEKLSDYVRQIDELHKDGYYLQKTKMMTYGQATMTMQLPKPPKEEWA